MFEQSRKSKPAWVPVFIALSGLAYTILNALGQGQELCITAGCTLFKDITVQGYSLWWAGSLFFGLVLILGLLGKRTLAFSLASLALLCDIFLLLFMAVTAPCVPCLVVAAVMALLFLALQPGDSHGRKKGNVLLVLWLFAFCPNIVATVNETMGTWAMYGKDRADMQVFFSPSCPVCQETVTRLSANPDARIAFFPVAETPDDVATISAMQTSLEEGTSLLVAFNRALRASAPDRDIPLSLRWNLFRNKAHLGSLGVTRIPVIITNGVPKSLLAHPAPSSAPVISMPAGSPATPSVDPLLPDINGFAGCGDDAGVPCKE